MKIAINKFILSFFFIYSNVNYSQILPDPESEEWKKLPIELRREACNILEEELVQITTEELLQKCLNYRFMSDILFTYEFRGGLDTIAEMYNGLSELFKRENTAKTILDFYRKLIPEKIMTLESSIARGKYSFNIVYLELYMTQPEILNQLNGLEEIIIKEIYKNLQKSIELKDASDKYIYSGFSISIKCLLIAVLLDHMKDKSVVNLESEFPKFRHAITNLSISELSEELSEKILHRASEL